MSEQIFTGNLYSPDAVSIPTVQNPMRPDQPITYARGQGFSVFVKYPANTKRLLFTVSKRIYSASSVVFQQVVFPKVGEAGVAEFFVGGETTVAMHEDLYYWDVFQLRDDGTRDIWAPYNAGTFSLVDMPSSDNLEIATAQAPDIYNRQQSNPRQRNLTITRGQDWTLNVRWLPGGAQADLSGYSATLSILEPPPSNVSVAELSTDNGKIALDDQTGIISASMGGDDTLGLPLGTFPYSLNIWRSESCDKITLISGSATVSDP